MENTSNILTVKEVADILRCLEGPRDNAIHGKVQGLPKLTHLTIRFLSTNRDLFFRTLRKRSVPGRPSPTRI